MITNSVFTGALTSALRAYVRYSPTRVGKELLFTKILNPYLTWRRFSTVAKTKFGSKFAVSLPDLIQSRIYFFGLWEPHLTHFVRKTLSKGDYFVDVGANIGYFSLLASQIVGPEGKVYSVEASPSIFRKLQNNVALNNCRNIELFNIAASDFEGTLPVYLGNSDNLGATTTIASVALDNAQKLEAKISAKPLQCIVGDDNLLRARLIKIDVEGAEPSVIRGITHLLEKFGEDTEWIVEIWPGLLDEKKVDTTEELLASFRKAGYKLYQITNDYRIGAYIFADAKFTLRELGRVKGPLDLVASKRER